MTNPRVEVVPIEQGATQDPNNTNAHTQKGRGQAENSIRRRGLFRPIAAAGKGVDVPVIGAGNQTFEIAADVGIKEAIIVHTRGDQIIINVRDDIAPGSPEFYALAIEDNSIGHNSFNPDVDIMAALASGEDAILKTLREQDKTFNSILEGEGLKDESQDAEPEFNRADELLKKWGVKTGDLFGLGAFTKCPKCGKVHELK